MTSSEVFQHHFSIISKIVCCGCYMKKCSFYTYFFCCTEMTCLFISSSAIWVTGSDTGSVFSRAIGELTRSKCEWTGIWTIYNVYETTPSVHIIHFYENSCSSVITKYHVNGLVANRSRCNFCGRSTFIGLGGLILCSM